MFFFVNWEECRIGGSMSMGIGAFAHKVQEDDWILSILVDTFISKISLPMQPVPEIGSISVA